MTIEREGECLERGRKTERERGRGGKEHEGSLSPLCQFQPGPGKASHYRGK